MNGDVIDLLNDCDNELRKISNWIDINKFDSNVRFLISYAVIKSCGSIEHAFKLLIYSKLAEFSSDEVKTYLQNQILDSSFNPKTDKIQQLMASISPEWNKSFTEKIKGTDEKGKLNSLVNLRNDFAHGSNINTSIGTIIDYYNSSKTILSFIDEVLKNDVVDKL